MRFWTWSRVPADVDALARVTRLATEATDALASGGRWATSLSALPRAMEAAFGADAVPRPFNLAAAREALSAVASTQAAARLHHAPFPGAAAALASQARATLDLLEHMQVEESGWSVHRLEGAGVALAGRPYRAHALRVRMRAAADMSSSTRAAAGSLAVEVRLGDATILHSVEPGQDTTARLTGARGGGKRLRLEAVGDTGRRLLRADGARVIVADEPATEGEATWSLGDAWAWTQESSSRWVGHLGDERALLDLDAHLDWRCEGKVLRAARTPNTRILTTLELRRG